MQSFNIASLSFKQLFDVYKQNKKQINVYALIVLCVAIVYTIITPFEYDADASILPPKQNNNSVNLSSVLQSSGLGGLGSIAGMQSTNLSILYANVIKSRSVSEFIIDSLKLQKTSFFAGIPRYLLNQIIQSSLNVVNDRSGMIYLTCSIRTGYLPSQKLKDSAALLSSEVANTAIIALDYVIRQRNNSVSGKTKDFIGGEINDYSAKLDSIQNELEKFQEQNKVLELEEQTKAIVLQANEIATKLAKAEVELKINKNLYSNNSQVIKTLQESYDVLKSQFDKIQSGGLTSTDNFSIPLERIPKLIREYSNLVREQKLYEQIIAYLRTIYFQEAIQEKKDVPQIDVLDWAHKPEVKSFPSYKLLFAITVLFELSTIFLYLFIKVSRSKLKD